VNDELNRRKSLHEESHKRKMLIAAQYKPLHPHVYTLKESYLADQFLSLVQYAKDTGQATTSGLLAMMTPCNGKYY